ncbi:MAG: tyrosine-type recombinase/integrase [Acetivibrio ethanolgignens]
MRCSKKTLPKGISLRKDGRYQGRFTFNGKRYTYYSRDVKELQKKMADARYELEHGIYGTGLDITLNHWFDVWMKEYKLLTVKNSTILLYSLNYERYVKESIGGYLLKDIKTIHIQRIYNEMHRQGLSLGTIQIVNSVLNNLFSQAVKNDYLMKNPCMGAILPKGEKREQRVLTFYEQTLFLAAIAGNFYEPLFQIALCTGLRIGELSALTWDDVDFEKKNLSVLRTLLYQKDYRTGEYGFRFQTPKSGSSKRIVPLIPDAVEILKKHRKAQKLYIMENQIEWKPVDEIQEGHMVKRLAVVTDIMNRLEKEIAVKENRMPCIIENITPHTLRHSFATRAFENGLAPKTVQELLGHSNMNITMDLYTHVTYDTKKREMEKMSKILKLSN